MFWNIIIGLLSYALQLALTPKPPNAKPKSLDDFQAPTAEEGREIPVIFGTDDVNDPNVTWYGDLKRSAIKGPRRYGFFGPRQVIGYKYSLGMQMSLCHGPADFITAIHVGDKLAWHGSTGAGQITINKPSLFGGDKSEGGISGNVDVCMGGPAQLQNDYLVSVLGSDQPAYRGVVSVVLRQVYLGTTAYIKPWEFRVQRILKRSDGSDQWYPEKAAIDGESVTEEGAFYFALDLTAGGDLGMTYMKLNMAGGLTFLRDQTDLQHDVRIVAFTGTVRRTITKRKCDDAAYDALQNWVDDLAAEGSPGDADFGVGVSQASSFFDGAGTKTRVVLVLSDDTCVIGSPDNAKSALDAIDDVAVFGFKYGRFTTATPNMNVFDNTPQDTTIDGNCPVYLTPGTYLNDALATTPIKNIDMNPAHIIRECLTDATWGMGYNDSDIDDTSFTACANTFFDEQFGLSLKWSREEEIQEFVSTVLGHIDAYLYVSRATGKFVLKAIRNDYDIDTIPVITEDDVVEWTEISRRQPSETSSAVIVQYYNRQKRKDGAHQVTNLAQAMQATKVISTTRSYPGINRSDLAIRVATRDVIALGSGLTSGRFITKRTTESMNPGDPFRLVSSRHELSGEVMRVGDLSFGDGRANKIGIKFFQDVFNLSATVLVDDSGSEWEPPSTAPQEVLPRLVQEMPYREMIQMVGDVQTASMLTADPGAGVLQVAGAQPTGDAVNAILEVDSGLGYVDADTLDFAPGAFLSGDLAIDVITMGVTGATDLDLVIIGSLAAIGDGTHSTTEFIRVDAIVGNVLTIARGCLDTVPQAHSEGTSVTFFDDFSLSDFEQYTDSDDVSVKLLTITGAGTLALAEATADTVTFGSRAIRPLRPANAQLNGQGYGTLDAILIDPIPASWENRNRLTDLSPVLGWDEGDVTPESGQTTTLNLTDEAGSVVHSYTGLTGTTYDIDPADFGAISAGYVVFDSERDGYTAWQTYRLHVLLASRLLLSGDEQDGTDHLALSGDEAGGVLTLS